VVISDPSSLCHSLVSKLCGPECR